MAFSHASTFGPRMKCCDSSTSATAASISVLIARYCALRSRRGTFIRRLFRLSFFDLAVRPGAGAEVGGQRRLLVQVETSEHAGTRFSVAMAGFRAPHHPIGIGRPEPMA